MASRRKPRFAAAAATLCAATAVTLVAAAPAGAIISPSRSPSAFGSAMGLSSPTGDFVTIPSAGTGGKEPNATSDTPLPGFPRSGLTFAVFTTGDATLADHPNDNGSSGLNLFGPNIRGDTDFDVSVLRLQVPVSAADNCLSLEFRFLTEEFPEFVNAAAKDAFIAELRTSNWTTSGGAISAPNNFAGDASGNPVTVDATVPYQAIATTYDSATRVLRASAPLTPADQTAGHVDLFLSIFDQRDGTYDSAAFVDNLVVDSRANCLPGAQPLDSTDPETSAGQPHVKSAPSARSAVASKKKKPKVTIPFSSSESNSTFFCHFALAKSTEPAQYSPCVSPFKAKVKKGKKYAFDVVAVDGAGNPDPTPVSLTFKAKGKKKK
jgi:hypothetical protein